MSKWNCMFEKIKPHFWMIAAAPLDFDLAQHRFCREVLDTYASGYTVGFVISGIREDALQPEIVTLVRSCAADRRRPDIELEARIFAPDSLCFFSKQRQKGGLQLSYMLHDCSRECLTLDMSGGWKRAKHAGRRPLDGRVRRLVAHVRHGKRRSPSTTLLASNSTGKRLVGAGEAVVQHGHGEGSNDCQPRDRGVAKAPRIVGAERW